MGSRYWLWDWIDRNNIENADDAARAIARRKVENDLRDRAVRSEPQLEENLKGISLLAGTGADLCTGGYQCLNPACQKHPIEKLFRRVWHYFDNIIVVDDLTHNIAHHWSEMKEVEGVTRFLTRIDVLLYVRKIGAENLVQFREKVQT